MTLEPQIAVSTLEAALRQLMTRQFEQVYGAEWLDRVSTGEQRTRWASLYDEEKSRRHGVAVVAPVGLAYSELSHLVAIADRHWQHIAPALGEKRKNLPLLQHVVRLRNSTQHSRDLMPFERELISGVAGLIRNEVTLYMSSQDPAGDTYPRIEAAHDSFGRAVELWPEVDETAGSVPAGAPTPTVRVGDIVTFSCVGIDPQGRDLRWWLSSEARGSLGGLVGQSGVQVELEWHVVDDDVRESLAVTVRMQAEGTQYHRAGTYDQGAFFMFRVRQGE
ncbi:hypothetical protein [Cellulomonas fengjieae]|uniref:Swt1-like HEPN domain-containing protein n=1 Tax=Cellulomonas fengjieae TaxID=2819978 RepID=A0ABS3SGL3_9CELL|nr:hypothetical protein [Cellulomonas fengjieae]MBO3084096.1 hypothetical protein [Cellulomonas fengjieae]QVI64649.1 hypothetical protein KG102_10675 [Cellulomonas fengjieae]